MRTSASAGVELAELDVYRNLPCISRHIGPLLLRASYVEHRLVRFVLCSRSMLYELAGICTMWWTNTQVNKSTCRRRDGGARSMPQFSKHFTTKWTGIMLSSVRPAFPRGHCAMLSMHASRADRSVYEAVDERSGKEQHLLATR